MYRGKHNEQLCGNERKENKLEILRDIKTITVETDETNPVPIATISEDSVAVADGYRVRLTPINAQCPSED